MSGFKTTVESSHTSPATSLPVKAPPTARKSSHTKIPWNDSSTLLKSFLKESQMFWNKLCVCVGVCWCVANILKKLLLLRTTTKINRHLGGNSLLHCQIQPNVLFTSQIYFFYLWLFPPMWSWLKHGCQTEHCCLSSSTQSPCVHRGGTYISMELLIGWWSLSLFWDAFRVTFAWCGFRTPSQRRSVLSPALWVHPSSPRCHPKNGSKKVYFRVWMIYYAFLKRQEPGRSGRSCFFPVSKRKNKTKLL